MNESNEIIFRALCKETSVVLKTLIEMLSQISSVENKNLDSASKSIKQLYLKITKDGLEMFSDSMKVVTSIIKISTNFFLEYNYEDEDSLCIGISLDILKSSFKNIHKNDIISITIDKDKYNNFPDKIIFTVNNIKGFSIKFNTIQNICNETNNSYKSLIEVSSQRLSNLYKEIGGIKKKVFLNFQNSGILRLQSSTVDICENWVDFKLTTNEEDYINSLPDIILKSEYFKIISKMTTFSEIISLNINEKGNIIFKSIIKNNLGQVSIKISNTYKN